MNWQLLNNVPPNTGQIIMLYEESTGTLSFGRIINALGNNQTIKVAPRFFAGDIDFQAKYYDLIDFYEQHPNMWWAPFIKP